MPPTAIGEPEDSAADEPRGAAADERRSPRRPCVPLAAADRAAGPARPRAAARTAGGGAARRGPGRHDEPRSSRRPAARPSRSPDGCRQTRARRGCRQPTPTGSAPGGPRRRQPAAARRRPSGPCRRRSPGWPRNQSSDGRWNAARHGAGRGRAGTGQHHAADVGGRADHGVTGLALLAFLGAGNTHREGPYAASVARGIALSSPTGSGPTARWRATRSFSRALLPRHGDDRGGRVRRDERR